MFGLRASKNRLEKGTRSSISQCTQPALILSWPVPACIGHRYVALGLASRVLQRPVVWDGALTITENSQKLPFRQPIAVRHQQLDTQATAQALRLKSRACIEARSAPVGLATWRSRARILPALHVTTQQTAGCRPSKLMHSTA